MEIDNFQQYYNQEEMKTVTLAQIYKDLVIKISDIVEQNGGAMTWAKVPDTKNIFIEIKIDTLGQGKIQFSKLTQENQAVSVQNDKNIATIQFNYTIDPEYTYSSCYGNRCEKYHYAQQLYYDFLMIQASVKCDQLIDCYKLKFDKKKRYLLDERNNRVNHIYVETKIRFQNQDGSYLVDEKSKFSLYACTCFDKECNDKLD
ncbi:hypothetical protein [Wolbachia endosymbiont (group A) of Brachyopa scutellaris]|uniref:hypothetical protein n=1 Tax=Wolbachia endosymbiont (group A) of Brachyopa scutellaris TaxID=3066140 RepID=UPI003132C0C6